MSLAPTWPATYGVTEEEAAPQRQAFLAWLEKEGASNPHVLRYAFEAVSDESWQRALREVAHLLAKKRPGAGWDEEQIYEWLLGET